MLPKVILHNSISLDGSLTNFEPNMELHYNIARKYKPQVHLIGSNTVKSGIEMFGHQVPSEEPSDFQKPTRSKNLPYWAIIDTKGTLKEVIHTCRRFEFCRDVILIISEKTPDEYIDFLKERNYDHHKVGTEHVDLKKTLELFTVKYNFKKVLSDTGRILGNLLLEQGLVSEISLLIHPTIVGSKSYPIFSGLNKNLNLELLKLKSFQKGVTWLVYKVRNNSTAESVV